MLQRYLVSTGKHSQLAHCYRFIIISILYVRCLSASVCILIYYQLHLMRSTCGWWRKYPKCIIWVGKFRNRISCLGGQIEELTVNLGSYDGAYLNTEVQVFFPSTLKKTKLNQRGVYGSLRDVS